MGTMQRDARQTNEDRTLIWGKGLISVECGRGTLVKKSGLPTNVSRKHGPATITK